MADQIQFYFDEHVAAAVALGLRRRDVDVVRAQEVGLRGGSDADHLSFATRESRVLVTQDADFLQAHRRGAEHSGMAYCDQGSRSIGEMISALLLIHRVLTPEEMRGRVEFL